MITFYWSVSFGQNTLPNTGNVGIGTMTPTNQLEVVGKTKLGRVNITDTLTVQKPVNFKDSLTVDKKLTVKQDVKIVGKTVMTGNVRAKSNLTVLGNTRTKGNEVVEGNTKILGITKMKGNAFVDGVFKFKGLADTTTTENRFLMIRPNGKAESFNKAGLLELVYSNTCLDDDVNTPAPLWLPVAGNSNPPVTTGVLYTGVDCAARVGIGTSNPLATFDARGSGNFSTSLNIGNSFPSSITTRLNITQNNPNKNGVVINMTNAGSPILTGVGIKTIVANPLRKAISVEGGSNGEVFNVMGNGNVNIKNAGKLIFDGTQPNWNTWEAAICTPVGGAWVTNSPNQNGYYTGIGMTTTGLYYGRSLNSPISNGSTNIQYLFSVSLDGEVHSRSVRVDLFGWSDFVFDKNYQLLPLDSLEKYIEKNNHLPNIPSEKELKEEGLDLAEMQKLQMQKIEELTLYLLEQQKIIIELKEDLELLKSK